MNHRIFCLLLVTMVAMVRCQQEDREKPGTCPLNTPNTETNYESKCSNDYDCEGKLKCCYGQCKNTEEDSRLPEKPGVCPKPGSVGTCAFQCSSDDDCPEDLKCCSTACPGQTCMKPAKVAKPGSCPAIKPGQVGICANLCEDDSDCKVNLKCCSTGCGTQCVKPVKIVEKPGTCPLNTPNTETNYESKCSNDYDCEGKLKCCYGQCKNTEEDSRLPEKPGVCPKPGSVGTCAFQCSSDDDCPEDLKCCSTACPGQTCMKPAKVAKPGSCPAIKPGQVGICANLCEDDSDCKGDLKCCFTGCGTQCVKPDKTVEKPGTCPRNKPGSGGTCIHECKNDYECKGNLKCCKNPCGGGVCVSPVEDLPPKPGSCPAIKPGQVGICANLCEDDSDCKVDLKCCSTGCGTQCVKPVKIVEKLGRCPAIKPGEVSHCAIFCSGDGSCEGEKKCCPNACGGSDCVTPERKPGTCPATPPEPPGGNQGCSLERRCSDDFACPGKKLCCLTSCGPACVSPVKPPPCSTK